MSCYANNKKLVDSLIGKVGIYSFFKAGVCLYVGKATCLGRRIKQHLLKRDDVDEIQIKFIDDQISQLNMHESVSLLRIFENFSIMVLSPKENIKTPLITPEVIWNLPLKVKRILISSFPRLIK